MSEYIIISVVIIAIIFFQRKVFLEVRNSINTLRNLFPEIKNLSTNSERISEYSGLTFDKVISTGTVSKEFQGILNSTNSYLKNNKGSAADFKIIEDIAERQIETLENKIESNISSPLYLGLLGTISGIVIGLIFFVAAIINNDKLLESASSIQPLIVGVILAMSASAIGLMLTILNSSFNFKDAAFENERKKNHYYDFIQANLLPKLSKDVSDSLNSLKSNLDHFNNKFGENLINYKDSFELLNQNLVGQKEFLEAVQEVGLRKLSTQIVKTFENINEASNHFHEFQQYQGELNKNVSASIGILKEYNQVSSTFSDFNKKLDLVSGHIVESSDFYHEFKHFLESHFSEVEQRKNIFINSIDQIDNVLTNKLKELSDKSLEQKDFYNQQWRSTVDILNKDIVELFSKMTEYVQNEAESLKKYISTEEHELQKIFESNKEFFKDFRYVEQLFNKFTTYAEISHKHQENVESGIKTISELLSNDASLVLVNKNLAEIRLAIEKLTISLSQKNIIEDGQKKK
jgi:biopolymer transport protein ExbB/TolQ